MPPGVHTACSLTAPRSALSLGVYILVKDFSSLFSVSLSDFVCARPVEPRQLAFRGTLWGPTIPVIIR